GHPRHVSAPAWLGLFVAGVLPAGPQFAGRRPAVAAAEPPWPAPGAGHGRGRGRRLGLLALGVQRQPARTAVRQYAARLADDRARRADLIPSPCLSPRRT